MPVPKTESSLYDRAQQVLPGGTFGNVDAEIIIREGKGSRVWDHNGKEYVDYLLGSGPMIVGHAHPEVTAAVQAQLEKGTTFFCQQPARDRAGRSFGRRCPLCGKSTFCEYRLGSRRFRDPTLTRLSGTQQDPQVRGRLPWF